jgi:nucleoid DNA-binding protein
MTKQSQIDRITTAAKSATISYVSASTCVKTFLQCAANDLESGKTVVLPHLGKIIPHNRGCSFRRVRKRKSLPGKD